MASILIIDDNDAVRTALEVLISLQGHRVLTASSPDEGLRTLAKEQVDLVMQDMNFRRKRLRARKASRCFTASASAIPTCRSILLTAWTHLETAVDLVKAGAADYIAKPWDDARLLTTVRNLLELRRCRWRRTRGARAPRRGARRAGAERFDLRGLVFESEPMHDVVTDGDAGRARRRARADHRAERRRQGSAGRRSSRRTRRVRSGPFIKVNAGALPES